MLFLATAILSASIHLLGAIDAPATSVVPSEAVSTAYAEVETALVSASATVPARVPAWAGPEAGESADAVALACGGETTEGVDGAGCLGELTRASSESVRSFAAHLDSAGDDVSALSAEVTADVEADVVGDWWGALDPSRRNELIELAPGLVGNLEGVPYGVRDEANRIFLSEAVAAVDDRLASGEAGPDDVARAAMLAAVGEALADRTSGAADRQLVLLDTVMPGRVAVSIGDLDAADDVSILVPGMLYGVTGQVVDWSITAGGLYDEQSSWAGLPSGRAAADAPSTAVVAWMGYRTPDLTNVYSLDLARVGAGHLVDSLAGLDAARSAHPARVTVVAHSYGSTTATLALSSGRTVVDSLVLLGSPGSVVETSTQLAVHGSDVYAAAGSFDPVAGSGVFGADPGSPGFGAVMLHTGGGLDGVTGEALAAALGHNDYLRPGTESLRSIALIGLGRGDLVDSDERTPGTGGPVLPDITLVRPQDLYARD